MYLARRTNDREIGFEAQQKIFFRLRVRGRKALLVAAGGETGYEWFFPYNRCTGRSASARKYR